MRSALWRVGLTLALVASPARAAFELEARLLEDSVPLGTPGTLSVVVQDPVGDVGEPQVTLSPGLQLLPGGRSESFQWSNGVSRRRIEFRFGIATDRVGTHRVGPVVVQVGRKRYSSPAVGFTVRSAGAAQAPGRRAEGSGGVGTLSLRLEPAQPWVGEACRLVVRFVQRVDLAEDARYAAPPTPGFWSEKWGRAVTAAQQEGARRVLVSEQSLRLYPLAPGRVVVPSAAILVVPAARDAFFGAVSGSPMEIASDSLVVGVRALPPGPTDFDGAIGDFALAWRADRSHAAQDEVVTVRLEVRGTGNLPMLRAPSFAPADFEVFSSTVEDSLPPDGVVGAGRRTFVWTLMPRRSGALRLECPRLVWFDPQQAQYRRAQDAPLELRVLAPSGATEAGADAGWPAVFRARPAAPGSSEARPAFVVLAVLLAAAAMSLLRRASRPDPDARERARQREWLRAVGLAHGPDFWRAADEAVAWLQARGDTVHWLREAIAAARYGGATGVEDEVRAKLVERLGAALPPPASPVPWRVAAGALVFLALVALVPTWPGSPEETGVRRALAADAYAREGRLREAESEWGHVWDAHPGDAALAARLAWAALERGDLASATVWVMRGERRSCRDAAVGFVADRVREAGGLVGAPGRSVPLRPLEWGALSLMLGLGALSVWRLRALRVTLLVSSVVAGLAWPAGTWWQARTEWAVVRRSCDLGEPPVRLEPGQVVRVLARDASGARVRAARDLEGGLPASVLAFPEGRP